MENKGWVRLDGCHQRHYFENGRALCTKIFYGGPGEQGESDNDCKKCRRSLTARENGKILHAFMLWYQEKYGRAASLAQMASHCPFWPKSGRQGARHAVKALARDGLVEQRQVDEPGQRPHKKWWALDDCSNCASRPVMKNQKQGWCVSLCQQCFDSGLGQQR